MNIVFAGTPEFAAVALAALIDAGCRIPLVLTQPDRPAGRGMALHASAVKRLALAHGIEVFQPPTLKDTAAQERLRAVDADLMIVAAYGLLLPPAVLALPRRGCLNIHASLLPRWRGAAPIQRAILAGDTTTGVCIMQMEAGLDTGPVLLAAETPIAAADTAATLHDRLAGLGARLIVDALGRLDTLTPVPQPAAGVTYAQKIGKAEAPLDFRRPAIDLDRQIRAFDPFPGATASLDGEICKLWAARPQAGGGGAPGEIVGVDGSGIVVACGDGSLRVTELQKPGGKRLRVAQFLAGSRWRPGQRFALT